MPGDLRNSFNSYYQFNIEQHNRIIERLQQWQTTVNTTTTTNDEDQDVPRLPILDYNVDVLDRGGILGVRDTLHPYTYGWELELAVPDENSNYSRQILYEFNEFLGGEAINLKYDGSITRGTTGVINYPIGYEIVTQPFFWNWWTTYSKEFSNLFNNLVGIGARSHQMGTCGLHVHIAGLNLSQRIKLFNLITKNPDFLVLSRRSGTGYCYFRSLPTRDLRDLYMCEPGAMNRYNACIYSKHDTMELRFFNGTLNFHSFQATLEFAKAVVKFVISNGLGTSPSSEEFYNFYEENLVDEFPTLTEYMQQRKVI